MKPTVRLVQDLITPDLRRKIEAARRAAPVLRAGAQELVNIARRSFRDPSLRAAPWAARKSDDPKTTYGPDARRRNAAGKVNGKPLLIKTTSLLRSLRVLSVTNDRAIAASDRPYARAHQFGYPPRNLSARPFFPFVGKVIAKFAHTKIGQAMKAKWESISGRRPK
ncbi:MAG: phage virion morphogenesis protein [Verrucomicrobia bacterium]|nr:phage virion morphogenesis protein [Verrucomicrobiota bacterium]